ncbi:DUF3047 domain-containing protein [Marinobacteraceae bacterium S3BR75-40.1]
MLEGSGWEALTFPNIDHHTRYALVNEEGQRVLKATVDDSASGLIWRQRISPGDHLWLHWRWKVSNIFEKGNARRKSGDDYPARIYVAFEFQPDKASWWERTKRAAVETLYGDSLPGTALNYIWASSLPQGESVPNPFTEDTRMIAVNSGNKNVGDWMELKRDIVADYRRVFGTAPPPIVGIAVMSDGDNTRERATAWYGDLRLVGGQN